jgi:hypothetical protein
MRAIAAFEIVGEHARLRLRLLVRKYGTAARAIQNFTGAIRRLAAVDHQPRYHVMRDEADAMAAL